MTKECDYDDLGSDEACLILKTRDEDYNATLYALSSDCVLCPFTKISRIQKGRKTSIKIHTGRSATWRIYNDSKIEEFRSASDESGVICQFQPKSKEYGIYELTINNESCDFHTIIEPHNPYIPLPIIIGVILCLILGFSLASTFVNLVRKTRRKSRGYESDNEDEVPTTQRVLSIDTFRGINVLLMIFGNNGAGGYAFVEHATWNGLYVGDLVFPCFLWLMGFCIPISLASQFSKGTPKSSIIQGIIKRSISLFLIGLSLNSLRNNADLETIRIFGVLQRFGVAYLFVSISYTLLSRRNEIRYENPVFSKIADFMLLLPQWMIIFIIIDVHCGITFFLPVPDCPTGYLGPGGRHDDGKYFNCTGGAAGYIDRIILGSNHLRPYSTINRVYGSQPFESEGILGCLTTILQTFLGVQAGKTFIVHNDWKIRIIRWFILALLCCGLSAALHFSDIIPINKNLWSLSFVLLTTGFALMLFTVCYLLTDVLSIWYGGPFRIAGMNALVLFIGHQICRRMLPFYWKYGVMKSHVWRTIAALWTTVTWMIVGYILHRKKIYLKV